MRYATRPGTARRGVSAMELALALPVLLTLVLACVDYGRFAFSKIAVTNAARAGAIRASLTSYPGAAPSAAWTGQVSQAVLDDLPSGDAFNSAKVTVTSAAVTESGGLWRAEVKVEYDFETMINWPLLPTTAGAPAKTIRLAQTVAVRGIR